VRKIADYSALLQILKRAAVEAVEATFPTALLLGELESLSPLTVRLDGETLLSAEELLITESFCGSDGTLAFTDAADTQPVSLNAGGGILRFTEAVPLKVRFKKELRPGDTLLLLREEKGRRYVLMDRVVKA